MVQPVSPYNSGQRSALTYAYGFHVLKKMKTYITLLLSMSLLSNLFGIGNSDTSVFPDSDKIPLERLKLMFENIEEQTDWDIDEPLLWGYFFTHSEPVALEKAKIDLEKNGYRFVSIYLSDKTSPSDPDMYWLHVEREETHTPESLYERNDELYLFAYVKGLDSYDGMDVGPIVKE